MAHKKQTVRRKLCTVNVACEDASIPEESDMCSKCRETLRKRERARTQPLRGERTAAYMELRAEGSGGL